MKQDDSTPEDTPREGAEKEVAAEAYAAGEHAQAHSPDTPLKPPLFNTWKGMYVFVLCLHTLVIAALYFFTLNYQ